MSYRRLTIDTSVVVVNPAAVDGSTGQGFRGTAVDSVAVLQLPAGANFRLHFGQQGDPWDILNAPWAINLCGPEQLDGVFFTNLVAGAGLVVLEVSYSSGPALTVGK